MVKSRFVNWKVQENIPNVFCLWVDELLKAANLKLKDLDALAFGRGPGSFTGVRIGTGIAQGLAFGADLPMLPISSLAAMAQGTHRLYGATTVLPAIDARMGEIYFAQYELNENGIMTLVGDESVTRPELLVSEFTHLDKTVFSVGTGLANLSRDVIAIKRV